MKKNQGKFSFCLVILCWIIAFILFALVTKNYSIILDTDKYRKYNSTQLSVSFEYPKNWIIREEKIFPKVPDMCFIQSVTSPYHMCVMYNKDIKSEKELSNFIDYVVYKNLPNFKAYDRLFIEKDNETWEKLTVDYEANKWFPIIHTNSTCELYGIYHSDGAIVIEFCTEKYSKNKAAPIFMNIFESFEIGDR